MQEHVFDRLIDIKNEELQDLRLDLERLGHLLSDAQSQWNAALQAQEQFITRCRELEGDHRISFSSNMMERRNYLTHLSRLSKQAEQTLQEITKQHDSAYRTLEKVYIERKTMELFAERKRQERQLEQRRKQFMVMDDEELRRIKRTEANP